MKEKKKTFWPYGITIAILAVVVMGAGTIMIALKHPVQMDEAYMKKYQNVDNHFNEIKKSEELFKKQYDVKIINSTFTIGKNSLDISVLDKYTGRHAENLLINVKITRPDDDRYDIKLTSKERGESYIFPSFEINKKGRWIMLVDVSNGKVSGYYKKEIDVY
jgi:hypothetical protein